MTGRMNIKQVADRLGISENSVKKKMRSREGAFPISKKISPRTFLFDEVDVEIYARGMNALSGARKIIECLLSDIPKRDANKINICGVYFLERDGEIVYIGQSINVSSRIRQHQSGYDRKEFDSVRILPCDKKELNNWEGFFIRLLSPKLNGAGEYQPKSSIWDTVISEEFK